MVKKFLKIDIFIILLISIFFFINDSWASVKYKRDVNNHKKSVKNISFHTVKKGETLYRIAKSNGMTVKDIMELNGLKSNKIKAGQKLVLFAGSFGKNSPSPLKKQVQDSSLNGEDRERGQSELSLQENVQGPESVERNYGIELEDMGTIGIILSSARDYLGVPYRLGGTSIRAFDCSGFVREVFRSVGIDLPRTAREQFKAGREVDRDEISYGDLVFFKTYSSYPSHVGIYIGNNYFIHASTKNGKVRIDSLDEPYYSKRFIGAKRVIEAETPAQSSDNSKSS